VAPPLLPHLSQAHSIGVPTLYFVGALCMLFMVLSIFMYVQVSLPVLD
jgi:hypothetical protein